MPSNSINSKLKLEPTTFIVDGRRSAARSNVCALNFDDSQVRLLEDAPC